MSSKWRYILGSATIALIVGGTIYAIKKSKDAEKEEGEAITLEEARAIVKEQQTEEAEVIIDELALTVSPGEEIPYGVTPEVEPTKAPIRLVNQEEYDSEIAEDEEIEIEDDPLRDDYPLVTEKIEGPTLTVEPLNDFYYFEEGIDPKEDNTLRYDPNSTQAKHQFIRMELADWRPDHDVYRIMIQLFEFPFIPTSDGDEILRTQIIDYKVQFFGFNSKWNKEVSYADIIFHYARAAEFNLGETVQFWVEYFVDFSGFKWDSTSQEIDTLILRLNSHTYFNDERETFGLFGLTRSSFDQAIRIANMNIDRSVTYEIEFQEFLKSSL